MTFEGNFPSFSWKNSKIQTFTDFSRHFQTQKISNSSWHQFIINPVYIINLMLWLKNIFECKNIKNDNYLYWRRKTLADFDHDQQSKRYSILLLNLLLSSFHCAISSSFKEQDLTIYKLDEMSRNHWCAHNEFIQLSQRCCKFPNQPNITPLHHSPK